VTFRDTPHLDGRHVAFGKLISGQDVLRVLELVAVDSSDTPRAPVIVEDCDQLGVETEIENDALSIAVPDIEAGKMTDKTGSGSVSSMNNSSGTGTTLPHSGETGASPEVAQEEGLEEQMAGMSAMEKRFCLLRMRMNKGRKENRTAVDEEYKK
jgi:hypothetical protein